MPSWKRNLVILWIAQFFAMSALSSVVPFLPLFIRELGVTTLEETALWSGLVFAAPFMVSLFLTPVWGNLGDRYGQKLMTVRAVFGLSLSLLLMWFTTSPLELVFYRILQGAMSGFYPAAIALAAVNTPKDKTGYALGVVQSANTSGNIIGPLIGGFLADVAGFRMVFVISGVLIGIIGFLILFFLEDNQQRDSGIEKHTLKENISFTFTQFEILRACVIMLAASLSISVIRPVFVLYIESFGYTKNYLPTVAGAVLSLIGLFSALSSLKFSKKLDKGKTLETFRTAILIVSLMYFSQFFITDIYLLVVTSSILGLGAGVVFPSIFSIISRNTPYERQAGILGIASSYQTLGHLIGPLIAGFASGYAGIRSVFLIAAFFSIIILILTSKRKNIQQ